MLILVSLGQKKRDQIAMTGISLNMMGLDELIEPMTTTPFQKTSRQVSTYFVNHFFDCLARICMSGNCFTFFVSIRMMN